MLYKPSDGFTFSHYSSRNILTLKWFGTFKHIVSDILFTQSINFIQHFSLILTYSGSTLKSFAFL